MPDIPMIDAKGQKVWVPTEFLEAALSQGFTQEPDAPAMQSREYGLRPLEVASREQLAGLDPQRRFLATATPEQRQRFEEGSSMSLPLMVMGGIGVPALIRSVGIKKALTVLGGSLVGAGAGAAGGRYGGGALGTAVGYPDEGARIGAAVGGIVGGVAGARAPLPKVVSRWFGGSKPPLPQPVGPKQPYWQRPGFKSGGTPPVPYGKSYSPRPSSSSMESRQSMLEKLATNNPATGGEGQFSSPLVLSPEDAAAQAQLLRAHKPDARLAGMVSAARGSTKTSPPDYLQRILDALLQSRRGPK